MAVKIKNIWGNRYIRMYLIFLHMLWISVQGNAQQPGLTSKHEKPLPRFLEEFSKSRGTRFAFDAVSFNDIRTNFSSEDISLEQLLKQLLDKHQIVSKQIDGTWLLILQNETSGNSEVKGNYPSSFSGFVRDEMTGENLIYCNLSVGGNRGGMTNEIGFFNFTLPDTDSVRVLISHLGYQRLDTMVIAGEQATFFLKPAVIMMNTVKVVYHEKDVLQSTQMPEKIAFNPLKTMAIPRISSDDLGNALLLIPGVEFFQGGLSGLSIRGSEPTDNLVLLDGIPVLETSHLLGNMSVLNAKFVQQAFVSRGGFDASYGGRISGLVELTGKSGKNNKPYFDFSANLLNTNILVNVPVNRKFSITAAWRRSFIDQWQNYLYFRLIDDVIPSDENPVTSTIFPMVKFQDMNAKFSFHPAKNFNADLNILYGTDNQSRDFELLRTQDFYRNESLDSRNAGLSLNLNWQANVHWFHSFSTGFSTLEKNETDETGELQTITETVEIPGKGKGNGKGVAKTLDRTYTRETHDLDNGFNQVEEFRAGWKSQYKKGIFASEAGAGWSSNKYNYKFFSSRLYDSLQIDSISNDAELNLLNVFVQQNIDLGKFLRFRWGIRTNYDPKRSKMFWQPRGGIEFSPVSELKFYFLSGVYYQFLSGIRRFDSEGQFSRIWYLPDKNGGGVVSGSHYILGGKLEKKGWYIDMEAYYKFAQGKMNLFAEYNQLEEKQVVSYSLNENKERQKGIDFFLQKKHGLFNHMAGYSFSFAEEQMNKFFDNNWFPGYNDRTHRLKLTEKINWRKWTLTGNWQFASGLPVYRYLPGQEVESFVRSGNFSQFNIALVKTFVNQYFSYSAGASLLNVFNRSNIVEVNYLRFSSDLGSMTVRSDVSALGTTPVFFMNIHF